MQLEKLQLDLRPRTQAQALDLGFALLRLCLKPVYLCWLLLWLPLLALCCVLAYWRPEWVFWWLLLPWWLRPLLERAPLYVLSREVFGEQVGWREALNALPLQLAGGWFRLLTWWRPFMPGRGLYQPIWQLEGLRGSAAADRRRVIGRESGQAAYWFGVACAHFEMVLQFGAMAFLGFFLSNEETMNPFAIFVEMTEAPGEWAAVLSVAVYGLSAAIIAPIYTACTFTLYLNRRATLEAWDVEIMLRQLKRRAAARADEPGSLLLVLPLLVLLSAGMVSSPAAAMPSPPAANDTSEKNRTDTTSATTHTDTFTRCERPDWAKWGDEPARSPLSPEQAAVRADLKAILDMADLREYSCQEIWTLKDFDWNWDEDEQNKTGEPPNLGWLAQLLQTVLIATALLLLGWLLYRYRGQFASESLQLAKRNSSEIAGFDIRPESLPDDVVGSAQQLWQAGERRAALALLYRATLSRLVHESALALSRGATEQDCIRIARRAQLAQQLSSNRLQVVTRVAQIWQQAAFGRRWPDAQVFAELLQQWQQEFVSPQVVSSQGASQQAKVQA